MKKIGFYVLGFKGYECLKAFFSEFGTIHVGFVVSARDKNTKEDCFYSIRRLCIENDIPFRERGGKNNEVADIEFAIGWRWIISSPENLIVFHDSLLPKYRGFAPLVNSLINGESEVGVTALRAAAEYDCGEILGQKKMDVEYPVKVFKIIGDISVLYAELLIEIAAKIISGANLDHYKQDESKATYSLWRDEADYKINWHLDAKYIFRFVNATGYPYKGAKTTLKGEEVRILECKVVQDVQVEERSSHIGKVIFMNSDLPLVICGEGLVQLNDVVDCSGGSLIGKIPFRTRFGL